VVSTDEAAALRQGMQPDPDWLERLGDDPVAVGKSEPLFALVDGNQQLVALGRMTPEGTPATALVIPGEPVTEDGQSCD
jgi:hypothetical protein